jgi:hypothetical protein
MKLSPRTHALAALFPLLLATTSRAQDDVVLVPFVPDAVRALESMPCQVHIGHRGMSEQVLRVERLRVGWGEYVLIDRELSVSIVPDADFRIASALVERLPHEVTEHQHERRAYAAAEASTFPAADVPEVTSEIDRRVQRLRRRYARGEPAPFAQPTFVLHLDQVFEVGTPPGEQKVLYIDVDYRTAAGALATATVDAPVTWLGPAASLPATLSSAITVHAGDLHVHGCHGEAVDACPPGESCQAETRQLSGSFTFEELKAQFQALGMDWFASTDHSYCIDTEADRAAIVAEIEVLNDNEFVCFPDLELSSDELGPQRGLDLGDLFCLGGTPANHMGAHGVELFQSGGTSRLLGFCDLFEDVLAPFDENVATLRAHGGFPVINHPAGLFYSWNSFEATLGQESEGLHGVEIWSGALQTGQDSNVGAWVDWLLAGRILYGYSGSDTHDNAFAFGANQVLLDEPFTPHNVQAALRRGHVYVSNGPVLVFELAFGGQLLPMGSIHAVPTSLPPTTVTLRAHTNFDTALGHVRLFRGRVGEDLETPLVTTAPFTGEQLVEFQATFAADTQTYYRAYAVSEDGTLAAYSNPVFLVPQGDGIFAWCLAKPTSQGCLPAIGWSGAPSASAGSGFTIEAEGVAPRSFGLLVYAYQPQAVPFQGGTLCVAPPVRRTPPSTTTPGVSCDARIAFDFNAWIASGVDPGLVPGTSIYAQFLYRDVTSSSGTGLTDATSFAIEP